MTTLKRFLTLIPFLGFWLMTGIGCGGSNAPNLNKELAFEKQVGQAFGEWIAQRGHAEGTVVVLVSPDAGGVQKKLEDDRVEGLKIGLGPHANVVEIPAADPKDLQAVMIQNNYLPLGFFNRALSKESNIKAVISLVGFPVFDPVPSSKPPLYLFAVTHQELARSAIRAGWADGVLYHKGADDLPFDGVPEIPMDVLQTYGLETL
jgi:hypothetical protein